MLFLVGCTADELGTALRYPALAVTQPVIMSVEDAIANNRKEASARCKFHASSKLEHNFKIGQITRKNVTRLSNYDLSRALLLEYQNCNFESQNNPEIQNRIQLLVDEVSKRNLFSTNDLIGINMANTANKPEILVRALFSREPRVSTRSFDGVQYKVLDFDNSDDVCRHEYYLKDGLSKGYHYKVCDTRRRNGYERRLGVTSNASG